MFVLKGYTALDMAEATTKTFLQGVHVSQVTEAAKYFDSLREDLTNVNSLPHACASASFDIPPADDFQQHDEDNEMSGIKDAATFKSLLYGGTYESYGNCIYLAGACKVGKSTLASLLIGDKIPLKWKSTNGLRIFFGRNGIDVKNRKMVPLKKGKENYVLSNVLRGRPDIKQAGSKKGLDFIDLTHNVDDVEHPPVSEIQQEETETGISDLSRHGGADDYQVVSGGVDFGGLKPILSSPGSGSSPTSVQKKFYIAKSQQQSASKQIQGISRREFTSIHEDIKAELRNGNYKVDIALSDLVDFGGQKSYDMTHQLFIHGKGTFTLIFDGRKGLRDRLDEYPDEKITTESILKHWVDSILTYCGIDDGDIVPVILFVATHRDYLKNKDEQSKVMAEFKQGLKEMFQNYERKSRIKYEDIFFINGTDITDPEVDRLKDKYVDIAFQQKSWGKRKPMAWVPLELHMSEMVADNISIISKKELEDLNSANDDLALDKKQLDIFLKCQHSLGKILYFEGQGLRKYIILQPASLVDILRSFITDKKFFPSFGNRKKVLTDLVKTGKILKKDLFKLWSQDKCSQHMPSDDVKEFVANVLVHLDLLVKPKSSSEESDFFLVPCMVKRKFPPELTNDLRNDNTLYMSYKLSKSSIPSALTFKLIGVILNVWPLKETENEICLYHKAAILNINEDNELRILGKDDRVVVSLVNKMSKEFISPDIASCAQDCLTLAIKNALEFYHNSFGQIVPNLEISNLLVIEVGEKCETGICFISLLDAKTTPSWKCSAGQEHNTEMLLHWSYDQKQESCTKECKGLVAALSECPSEQHLVRLAGKIGIKKFKEFVTVLGVEYNEFEDIEYQNPRDALMIKFVAFCEWKQSVTSKLKKPSFKMLYDALNETEQNIHWLCQIFRENRLLLGIENPILQTKPDNDTLKELSRKIGNCALHLGVELGVETIEIERTNAMYSKDIFEQNYDILKKWGNSGRNKTLRFLMHTLQIVDPRGLTYLANKYKIRVD